MFPCQDIGVDAVTNGFHGTEGKTQGKGHESAPSAKARIGIDLRRLTRHLDRYLSSVSLVLDAILLSHSSHIRWQQASPTTLVLLCICCGEGTPTVLASLPFSMSIPIPSSPFAYLPEIRPRTPVAESHPHELPHSEMRLESAPRSPAVIVLPTRPCAPACLWLDSLACLQCSPLLTLLAQQAVALQLRGSCSESQDTPLRALGVPESVVVRASIHSIPLVSPLHDAVVAPRNQYHHCLHSSSLSSNKIRPPLYHFPSQNASKA